MSSYTSKQINLETFSSLTFVHLFANQYPPHPLLSNYRLPDFISPLPLFQLLFSPTTINLKKDLEVWIWKSDVFQVNIGNIFCMENDILQVKNLSKSKSTVSK